MYISALSAVYMQINKICTICDGYYVSDGLLRIISRPERHHVDMCRAYDMAAIKLNMPSTELNFASSVHQPLLEVMPSACAAFDMLCTIQQFTYVVGHRVIVDFYVVRNSGRSLHAGDPRTAT